MCNQFYVFKCCAGFGRGITPAVQTSPIRRPNSPDHPNPALPITETPSPAIARIGWALRVLLITDSSSCLKDRKVSPSPVHTSNAVCSVFNSNVENVKKCYRR